MNNVAKEHQKQAAYMEFIQRESGFERAGFLPEMKFYSTIREGDIEGTKKLCDDEFKNKKGLGVLSNNPVNSMKYHFAITAAMIARVCIEGGMELSQAYTLSDYYIKAADESTTIDQINELHPKMCLDYARRMKKLKKEKIYSKHIVNCIDYIYDNLHKKITLEELAERNNLAPAYLSRLFKKETGFCLSDYICDKKIETAANMLVYSDYSIAMISEIFAFPNQSYFSHVFKNKYGMTPNQYRNKNYRNSMLENDEE